MSHYIQVLLFVIAAIVLLWFGYTLFLNLIGKTGWRDLHSQWRRQKDDKPDDDSFLDDNFLDESKPPGVPKICPVCSSELWGTERVKSLVYPSLNGGKDRLMHIRGCIYCLNGEKSRICPVCGHTLEEDEILVARMFQRSLRRSHVHVLGCSKCHIPKRRR